MSPAELDATEVGVPELAVQALTAAHDRALRAGRAVMFVQDGQLVRMQNGQKKVVGIVAPRVSVRRRHKPD